MTRTDRAGGLLATILLLAIALGLTAQRIHVDHPSRPGFFGSDLVRYHYPTAAFIGDEVRAGRLPLWNPYQMAGQPLLGLHVPAVLYPFNLLLFGALPPALALAAHAVVHLFLAGVFTWLFAARLGLHPAACLLAAVTFMLSAPTLGGIYMLAFASTQTWLPAIFWALHGLCAEARLRWAIALAAFAALAFLGGHAQGFVFESQLGLAFGVFGLFAIARQGTRLRVVVLAAIAVLITVGLVAPQLLPAWEHARDAVRGFEGLPRHLAARPFVLPVHLLESLIGPAGQDDAPPGIYRWLLTPPLVALPLLFLGALARGKRRYWLFFTIALVIVSFLMVGPRSPAFAIYYAVPPGNLFRGPIRMAFLYAFLVAMLAALGASWLLNALASGSSRSSPGSSSGRRTAAAVSTFLLVALLADLYRRTELFDLHPAAVDLEGATPAAVVDLIARQPDRPRVFIENAARLYDLALLYKTGTLHHLFVLPDYEPSMPKVYEQYFEPSRAKPWHGRLSLLPELRRQDPETLGRLLDLMSVRYIAAHPGKAYDPVPALEAFAGDSATMIDGVALVTRPAPLPRAYAVGCAIAVPDVAAALTRIRDPAFRPRVDATMEIPAEDSPDALGEAAEGDTGTEVGAAGTRLAMPACDEASMIVPASVRMVAYEPQRVDVDCSCQSRCLLVLTDLYDRGWRAYVDERPWAVERANALFRGVVLEPGRHRVVFRYEPWSFRFGLLLCGVTLAATAIAGVGARLRRRRRTPPAAPR